MIGVDWVTVYVGLHLFCWLAASMLRAQWLESIDVARLFQAGDRRARAAERLTAFHRQHPAVSILLILVVHFLPGPLGLCANWWGCYRDGHNNLYLPEGR